MIRKSQRIRAQYIKAATPHLRVRALPKRVYSNFFSFSHDNHLVSLLASEYHRNRRLLINKIISPNFHNASQESSSRDQEDWHCQLAPTLPRYASLRCRLVYTTTSSMRRRVHPPEHWLTILDPRHDQGGCHQRESNSSGAKKSKLARRNRLTARVFTT